MPSSLDRILNPTNVDPFDKVARAAAQPEENMSASAASLISYKRVPKACTQCRRNKSKCDKVRPCNGCIRKGRVDLCIDGCVACRQSRLCCDGSRPCIACREAGRECVEDDPVAIAASKQKLPTASTSTRPIKPYPRVHTPTPASRIKLACLNCRRDNKKCAGGERCPRCLLRDEECVYIARAPKFVKQRCALCRRKNKKCEKTRPCGHCVKADVACVDLPRKGIGHGLRVKKACEGCRADKIQCEMVRPCAACKRKKVECVERECKICVETGSKCEPCRRQDHFHPDDSPSGESESPSEDEEESVTTPSLPSLRPSLSRYVLPLDPRLSDEPCPSQLPLDRAQTKSDYAPMHNPGFTAPHTGLSVDAPSTCLSFPFGFDARSMRSSFPYTPRDDPMGPILPSSPFTYSPDLPSFLSSGFHSTLSLSASMSHVRTRHAHEADD